MAKRNPWAKAQESMTQAAAGLHKKDRERAQARDRERVELTMMALNEIKPRPHGNARPLDPRHVEDLAHSIAALGLIQPPAVDRGGNLIAGAHRIAALKQLEEQAFDVFTRLFPASLIPVRTMIDLDAEKSPNEARAAELEENEKRKGMTRQQVLSLANELRQNGYRFVVGRPKSGQAGGLGPVLATASGKSLRTVRRWLAESQTERTSGNGDNVTNSTPIDEAMKRLNSAILSYRKLSRELDSGPAVQRLDKTLDKLPRLMVAAKAELDAHRQS